jgi:hypothetical protein
MIQVKCHPTEEKGKYQVTTEITFADVQKVNLNETSLDDELLSYLEKNSSDWRISQQLPTTDPGVFYLLLERTR